MQQFHYLKHRLQTKLARSFEDALRIASDFNYCQSDNDHEIDCWIAGGADIYKEALQHTNLLEVNLTYADMEIDSHSFDRLKRSDAVTCFPMDAFHRIGFEEVSSRIDGNCTFCVYKRKERQAV